MGVVEDISDQKRAEQFREDVERIIRHDMKGPLVGLHSMAQFALEYKVDGEFRALAPGLLHGIRQVINLVDSSDKILQMEHGVYTPKSKWFDLRSVLREVELSLCSLFTAKEVALSLTGLMDTGDKQEEARVFGEEYLLQDMLTNLVKNAVEASPENGEVRVCCRADGQALRIDIHNQGAVPEAVRETFFEKYATAGKAHGTGLGTYSAQLIARAHGGRMTFTTSESEGTTVTVILPVVA